MFLLVLGALATTQRSLCKSCVVFFDSGEFHVIDKQGCRVSPSNELDPHSNPGGLAAGYELFSYACVTRKRNIFSIPYICYRANRTDHPCL
jgi:hypothetical protein